MEKLPLVIQWRGKRASLLIEELASGSWTAEYCYKRFKSKNGGYNTDTVVVFIATTKERAATALFYWWQKAKNSISAKAKVKKVQKSAPKHLDHATHKFL